MPTETLPSPAHAPPSPWARLQPWVSTAVRLGLAAVALAAGLSKIGDLPASVRAVRAYELLPEGLAVLVGNGLPMVEIILGVLLAVGLFTRAATVVFGALMVVFVAGIVSAWARGLAIDCGCFGGGGPVEPDETAYLWDILRDLLFVAGAVFLVRWPRTRFSLDRALSLTD
jgi:uncharacterized membrane protein YphA (DoxX/SURF4 family)